MIPRAWHGNIAADVAALSKSPSVSVDFQRAELLYQRFSPRHANIFVALYKLKCRYWSAEDMCALWGTVLVGLAREEHESEWKIPSVSFFPIHPADTPDNLLRDGGFTP